MSMRTLGIIGWLLAALAFFTPEAAHAVCGSGGGTCYALTGNTNVGTSWSDTDGGGNCNGTTCAAGPAATDNCVLTSNSGALTLNASLTCKTFNACAVTGTAAYAGTLTHNTSVTLTIGGNDADAPAGGTAFCLSAGMTYTPANFTRIVTTTATSGISSITTNGKTLGQFVQNGAGGTALLVDPLTVRSDSNLVLTAGTLDFNGQAVSTGTFQSNNTNTRVLICDSTITITTTGSTLAWSINDAGTGLTVTPAGCTILVSAVATGTRTFSWGGKIYNDFTVTNASVNSFPIVFGATAVTFANIAYTNVQAFQVGAAQTITVSGNFTWTGTDATNQGLWYNVGVVNLALAGTSTWSWLTLNNVNENGAGSVTCNSCFNAGGNSNITINAPTGGGGGRIIGG